MDDAYRSLPPKSRGSLLDESLYPERYWRSMGPDFFNADSLQDYVVVDVSEKVVGKIHTLAYDQEARVLQVLGIMPDWAPSQVVLLPWEGCAVDTGTRTVTVPALDTEVRQREHLDVPAEVASAAEDQTLEAALDRFIASMNDAAPQPQREVDLVHRLANEPLSSESMNTFVLSILDEAQECGQKSVRLHVPEYCYDEVAARLDELFHTSYGRGITLQEPLAGRIPLELNRERPFEPATVVGAPTFTEKELHSFPIHVASLAGHGM